MAKTWSAMTLCLDKASCASSSHVRVTSNTSSKFVALTSVSSSLLSDDSGMQACNYRVTECNQTHCSTLQLLHPFKGLFSRTTWVSQFQKSKTSLDLNEARDHGVLGRQWHKIGPYANNLHLNPDRQPHQHLITSIFTGWVNQQRQSTV